MKLKKTFRIKIISYGIAFQTEDQEGKFIEVSKYLKNYPILYNLVMDHEEQHLVANGVWENFKVDFWDMFDLKKQVMLLGFAIRHPSAFGSVLPLFWEDKKVSVNWFASAFWLLILFLVYLLFRRLL